MSSLCNSFTKGVSLSRHNDSFIISNASCSGSATREQLKELDGSVDRIVTKTCTLTPRRNLLGGSSKKTYYYDGYGAVNSIGLINEGFDYYKDLRFSTTYTISIAGRICELNEMLSAPCKADFFELNISCPNIGLEKKYATIDDLKEICGVSQGVGLKLPPLYSGEEVKRYCNIINKERRHGFLPIEYVVCCNTITKGILDGVEGSLSGKYLQPTSLWNVSEFRKYLNPEIKIFGCGGISTNEDIQKYKEAGASGVQVGTEFIEKGVSIFSRL